MKHLSEEEMIAQVYGEGDKTTAKRHLEGCAECSKAYAGLQSDLAEMKFADPPELDAFYGERVWASLSGSLHAYRAPASSCWHPPSSAAGCGSRSARRRLPKSALARSSNRLCLFRTASASSWWFLAIIWTARNAC